MFEVSTKLYGNSVKCVGKQQKNSKTQRKYKTSTETLLVSKSRYLKNQFASLNRLKRPLNLRPRLKF